MVLEAPKPVKIVIDPTSIPTTSETTTSQPELLIHSSTKRGLIVRIIIFCSIWYVLSTIVHVSNKFIIGNKYFNFKFPMFLTMWNMICHSLFSALLIHVFKVVPPPEKNTTNLFHHYLYKVLPCAFATALDISLSNASLRFITLSFYTMVKSSSPIFVLTFAFAFKLEKPTWQLISIILVIAVGVLLTVISEVDFNPVGFVIILSATICSGLRWTLTQILLGNSHSGRHPIQAIYELSPMMALTLIPVSAILEGFPTIFSSVFFSTVASSFQIVGIILGIGIASFVMILAEFKLLSITSVITLSVAGILKELVTIGVSVIIFGDVLTALNIFGFFVAIFGIGLYNYFKYKSMGVSSPINSPNRMTFGTSYVPLELSVVNLHESTDIELEQLTNYEV